MLSLQALLLRSIPSHAHFAPIIKLICNFHSTALTLNIANKKGQAGADNVSSSSIRQPTAKMVNMMDIGSRSLFTPDQDQFREVVRKFFQQEFMPHLPKWEERGFVDREVWQKAGQIGMLGISIPSDHGGVGGSFADAVIPMEEVTYVVGAGAPGFSLHSDIIMPYISKYGNTEQRSKYIPGMTAGNLIVAIAMTEPDSGSDLQGIKTFARKDGSDYILNGSKVFISNGWLADVVIVVAVTNREAKSPAHGISLFLVDKDMPGFTKSLMKKIGMAASDTAALFFEDVRLPRSALLGEENKGFYYLMSELPQERLLVGVHACAHSEFMFEETRRYVMERKAYGKTLSNLQTVQHKLADLKTEICVTRAFMDQCISLHEQGQLDAQMASMAKMWATELDCKVATQCLQLHGGAGYLWDTPVARGFLDSRPQTIYGGANEVLKNIIARQIFAIK